MQFCHFPGPAVEEAAVAEEGTEVVQAFGIPFVEDAGGDEGGEVEPGGELVAVPAEGEGYPFGESPNLQGIKERESYEGDAEFIGRLVGGVLVEFLAEPADCGYGEQVVEQAVEGGDGSEQQQEQLSGFDVLAEQGAVVDAQVAQALCIGLYVLPKGRPGFRFFIAQGVPFFQDSVEFVKFFFGAEPLFALYDFAGYGEQFFFLFVAGVEEEPSHVFLEGIGVGAGSGTGVFAIELFVGGEGKRLSDVEEEA